MIRNVKPTRMELLKTRRRIELAKKGHKLLKEKRDALFNEFFSEISNAKKMRAEMQEVLEKAFGALALAHAQEGSLNIESFALDSAASSAISLEKGEKNIMGTRVQVLKGNNFKRSIVSRGYSVVDSSALVDETSLLFETALEKIVALASKETLLERLSFEIAKTKRKVNALEKVTIPRLEATRKYIKQRLEERERETFFTLKKVKKKKREKSEQQQNPTTG